MVVKWNVYNCVRGIAHNIPANKFATLNYNSCSAKPTATLGRRLAAAVGQPRIVGSLASSRPWVAVITAAEVAAGKAQSAVAAERIHVVAAVVAAVAVVPGVAHGGEATAHDRTAATHTRVSAAAGAHCRALWTVVIVIGGVSISCRQNNVISIVFIILLLVVTITIFKHHITSGARFTGLFALAIAWKIAKWCKSCGWNILELFQKVNTHVVDYRSVPGARKCI